MAGRASPTQIEALLNFFTKHPGLAQGLLRDSDGTVLRARARQLWDSISNRLNSIGDCKKSVNQWQKFWTDRKCIAKRKYAAVALSISEGGGPLKTVLSDSDHKIIAFMGWDSEGPQIKHCKENKLRKKQSSDRNKKDIHSLEIKSEKGDQYKEMKKEKYEESTCRVCLKQGDLSIYEEEDISRNLCLLAGIEVSKDDAYPKYLCHPCNQLLKGAILLREIAQSSDQTLRQAVNSIAIESNHDFWDESSENVKIESTEYTGSDASAVYSQSPLKRDKNINKNVGVKKEIAEGLPEGDDDDFMEQETTEKKSTLYCRRCALYFATVEKYRAHKLTKEHKSLTKTCPVCNKSYKKLDVHIATMHKSERPHMCDICGKTYAFKGRLTDHRKRHFIGDLPFKCAQCPYRGRSRDLLKFHIRTHTNERPYQCPLCPTRFFTCKSNMNKHMFTHKTDHKYKCEQCQKGFHMRSRLFQHIKVVHHGIKDYQCNLCGKSFGTPKQMRGHQLKIHKRAQQKSGATPLYKKLALIKEQKNCETSNCTVSICK